MVFHREWFKINMKRAKQGDIVNEEHCPKCKDSIMIKLKSGEIEVFECENCKFKVKKKNGK